MEALKRKLKDVLRKYWSKHRHLFGNANIKDHDVARNVAETILLLYCDRPVYKPLKDEMESILEYLTRHINLSEPLSDQQLANSKNNNDVHYNSYTIHNSHISLSNPSEELKSFLFSELKEYQLPFILLLEGIPITLSEDLVRTELIKALKLEYNLHPVEISKLQVTSNDVLYIIALSTVKDCQDLHGKAITLSKIGKSFVLYQPPIHIPSPHSTTYFKVKNKMLKNNFSVDPKKTPTNKRKRYDFEMPDIEERTADEEEEFYISRILNKNEDNKNNFQYLLSIEGQDNKNAKLWISEEHINKILDTSLRNNAEKEENKNKAMMTNKIIPKLKEIVGAIKIKDQLLLSVKWENIDVPSLIPASVANIISPELVIEFYEKRLVFGERGEDK